MDILVTVALIVSGGTLAYLLLKRLFVIVVRESQYVLVERMGKFNRVLGAGIHLKLPLLEGRAGKPMTARLQQAGVRVAATTKDNVTVTLDVAIRHRISDRADDIRRAFYGLLDPAAHLDTLTQNFVSKLVGEMDFDQVRQAAANIAEELKEALEAEAAENGYVLKDVVVTRIDADSIVRDAGNRARAALSEREELAALAEAETARKNAAAAAVAEMLKKFKAEGVEGDPAVLLVAEILRLEAVQVAAESDDTTIVVSAGSGGADAALASVAQRGSGRSWRG